MDRLKAAYNNIEADADFDLVFAKALYETGYVEDAHATISRLKHIRCDGYQNSHGFGLTDVSYTVTLRCLQDLLGIEEGPVPGVNDNGEEAVARIETAARRLGVLLATAKSGSTVENLRDNFRAILLFHNRSVAFSSYEWRKNYLVSTSKPEIYRQLIGVARQFGPAGMHALRDEFIEIVQGPAATQFHANQRRSFALAFYEANVLGQQDAAKLGLSLTSDADDDDPIQRQQGSFDIAVFLHNVGHDAGVEEWLSRASSVSAGAGSHKDYHLAQLSDWLARSMENTLNDAKLIVLDKFARGIEVAGGAGGSQAATNLLALLTPIDPSRPAALGIEFGFFPLNSYGVDASILLCCGVLS